MISKLIYIFKRDRRFYILLLVIAILEIFPGDLINKLSEGLYEGLFIAIIFNKSIENRREKINTLLGVGVTRRELYTLTIILDFLNSILISSVITLNKIKIDNMYKNCFMYVFLFYFVIILVFLSTLSFNQIFKHTDYEAITWGTWYIFVPVYFVISLAGIDINNFTNFNEKLVPYKDFTLKHGYIIFLITIAFNYITSYLVHKGIEIKIKGEAE